VACPTLTVMTAGMTLDADCRVVDLLGLMQRLTAADMVRA